MSEQNIVTFFDSLGRTIIGEQREENETTVTIKNPVVVNIVPQKVQDPSTGQTTERMALQLLPMFFKEFLADKNAGVEYVYQKDRIVQPKSPIVFDFKLSMQYTNMFKDITEPAATATQSESVTPEVMPKSSNNVINLFDDK